MANYLIFKGRNSNTIKGLLISELPPITKPKMRYKKNEVDGVDGAIFEELGYSAYTKTVDIGLYGKYDINDIIQFFSGKGTVIFSNESDYFYDAVIYEQIDYERLARFRTAKVKFIVQPYKYKTNLETINVDVSTGTYTLTNTATASAKPKLTIKGTDTVEFKKNGLALFTYTFDNDQEVVIDSEMQDAYQGIVLKNRQMNGDFLTLDIGDNVLSWEGSLTSLKIDNWERWL